MVAGVQPHLDGPEPRVEERRLGLVAIDAGLPDEGSVFFARLLRGFLGAGAVPHLEPVPLSLEPLPPSCGWEAGRAWEAD